ncbi:MAG: hypothetical protein ACRC8Y_07650 [Chroococcales cyanobacterium]
MNADIDFYELGRKIGEALSYGETFEPIDFKAARKNKSCNKGYPCKGTCISARYNCRNPLTGQTKSFGDYIKSNLGKLTQGQKSAAKNIGINPKTGKQSRLNTKEKAVIKKAIATDKTIKDKGAKRQAEKAATQATSGTTKKTGQDSTSPIKLNEKELSKTRKDLVSRFGKDAVEAAEKNVDSIIKKSDIHIRVGNTDTLGMILQGGFKTAHELNRTDHNVFLLKGDYLTARARVEAKSLGYDKKNTDPGDRPIYGYLGSKNPKDHLPDVSAYGSITVKLRSEVKDRATITGSDSFKSGIASQATNDGTPPPPSAASLVPTTRHGYDLDKLPAHYPPVYRNASSGDALAGAIQAKNAEDLAKRLAPTGNAYVEAQVHGGVKPSDIGEIHFAPKNLAGKGSDYPTQDVLDWAKANNVKMFVNGKEINSIPKKYQPKPNTPSIGKKGASEAIQFGGVYEPPKAVEQKDLPPGAKISDLRKALQSEDFDKALSVAMELKHAVDTGPSSEASRNDPYMAVIAKDTGANGLPKIADKDTIDSEWKKGGHLLARAVPEESRAVDFAKGEYFVGNLTVYGSGQYAVHAGTISQKKGDEGIAYDPANAEKNAKSAWGKLVKGGYAKEDTTVMRMALPSSANVTTQKKMQAEIQELDRKIDAWARSTTERLRKEAGTVVPSEEDRRKQYAKTIDANVLKKPDGKDIAFLGFPGDDGTPTSVGGVDTKVVKLETADLSDGTMKGSVVTEVNGRYSIYPLNNKGKVDKKHRLYGKTFDNQDDMVSTAKEIHVAAEIRDNPDLGINKSTKEEIFESKVKTMKNAIYGDSAAENKIMGDSPSGRYALITGYDGVMLNDSYEPKEYFIIYNRSKAILQNTLIDWQSGNDQGLN